MKQMNALREANFLTLLFLFDKKIQFDYMTGIISNKLSKQKIMRNFIQLAFLVRQILWRIR